MAASLLGRSGQKLRFFGRCRFLHRGRKFGTVATKKNPKQSTRLGFSESLPQLRLIGTGRRGVGGWGSRPVGLMDGNMSMVRRCNADHALVLSARQQNDPRQRAFRFQQFRRARTRRSRSVHGSWLVAPSQTVAMQVGAVRRRARPWRVHGPGTVAAPDARTVASDSFRRDARPRARQGNLARGSAPE